MADPSQDPDHPGGELIPFPNGGDVTERPAGTVVPVAEGQVVDDAAPLDLVPITAGPPAPTRRPDTPVDLAYRHPLLTHALNRQWRLIGQHIGWRARVGSRLAPYLLLEALQAALSPVRAGRGARRLAQGFVRWHTAAEYTELISQVDGPDKAYAVTMTRDTKRTERALFWANPLACGLLLLVMVPINVLYWWARFFTLPSVVKQAGLVLLAAGYVACALAGRNRQLVTSLEMARDVVVDTAAIVEAAAAAKLGAVRVLGAIAREEGLVEATVAVVELPPGGVAAKAVRRTAELASALGVDYEQVEISPMRGQGAGRFSLWVADEDPFGEGVPQPRSPLLDAPRTSVWEPLPAAYTQRGRQLTVALGSDFAGLLIGGEQGSGKSASANTLLSGVALDPYVELIIADGKGIDSRPWWDIASHVTTADPDGLAEQVEDLLDEHKRRAVILGELGEEKVTAQIAREHGLHMKLLWVDELAFFVADKSTWKKTGEPLRMLVALCRATGIRVVSATQKPEADVVPSKLRDMFSGKWALRCTTPDMSNTILGRGWAAKGADASLIDADRKGTGYLKDETGAPVLCRSYYLDKPDVKTIAKRAYELREKAGTLPVRDWPPLILQDMLVAFAGEANIHTVDLLAALEQAGHDLPHPDALADALRPYGVRSADVWAGGRTRKGYRRADVEQAIQAGPQRPS